MERKVRLVITVDVSPDGRIEAWVQDKRSDGQLLDVAHVTKQSKVVGEFDVLQRWINSIAAIDVFDLERRGDRRFRRPRTPANRSGRSAPVDGGAT